MRRRALAVPSVPSVPTSGRSVRVTGSILLTLQAHR